MTCWTPISEKQARSIESQMTIAKLPLAKEISEFGFEGRPRGAIGSSPMVDPVNEMLVRDLAGGDFLDQQRNAVLIGGTGTGKSHLPVAIARSIIRSGARGRFTHHCGVHETGNESWRFKTRA